MIRALVLGGALAAAALTAGCATSTDGSAVAIGNPSGGGATAFPTGAATSVAPGSASSAPTSAAAPSSASASEAWPLATARRNYLAYVVPVNTRLAQLNTVLSKKSVPVRTLNDVCSTVANAEIVFATQLQAGHWPASVQPAVDRFVPVALDFGHALITCSSAATYGAAVSAVTTSPNTNSYANAVRAALGLPKVK